MAWAVIHKSAAVDAAAANLRDCAQTRRDFSRAQARTELDGLAGGALNIVDGAFRPGADVHAGVAVALRSGGLVAPALHDADHGTLAEHMPDSQDLVTRARKHWL